MKISQKGMIIVFVPLLVETLMIAGLAFILVQAESDLKKEIRSSTLVSLTGSLSKLYYDGVTAGLIWRSTKSEMFLKRYDDSVKEINETENRLRTLLNQDPEQRPFVAELEKDSAQAKAFLYKLRSEESGDNDFLQWHAVQRQGQKLIQRLTEGLVKINQYAKNQESASISTSIASRRWVVTSLWAFLVANIVMAVMLTVFFTKNITGRLALLSDNARRLRENKKLNAPLSQTDEIGELDRVFHETARALAEATAQKQQLMDTVAHDLRTPLTSIQLILNMLAAGNYGVQSAEASIRLKRAEGQTARLVRLVNDLLDFDKLDSQQMKFDFTSVEAGFVIDIAMEAVQELAREAGVTIKVDAADSDLETKIHADKDRLAQVMINLLGNALNFSPANQGAVIEIKVTRPIGRLQIDVLDRGPGVTDDDRQLIFERYKQSAVSAKTKGTGLGLPICKLIVEAHGGVIGVRERDGGGANFFFTVPLA
jgi:signal transduction histidine kinase